MDSLPTGSETDDLLNPGENSGEMRSGEINSAGIGSGEILSVRTDLLRMTIKDSGFKQKIPEKESAIEISCASEFSFSVTGSEPGNCSGCGRVFHEIREIPPIFFEQKNYLISVEPAGDHVVEFFHENPGLRKMVAPLNSESKILTGILNFKNDIGYSDLIFRVDGKSHLKVTIEVFPSKIDYKKDYENIRNDVQSEIYNLIFDFMKKTYHRFGSESGKCASPVEFFEILRAIFDKYISAADLLIKMPHHIQETSREIMPARKARRADSRTIRWIASHPEYAKRDKNEMTGEDRILAEKVMAAGKQVTFDTKENRMTKYLLLETAKRLEDFQKRLVKMSDNRKNETCSEKENEYSDIIPKINKMSREIRRRTDASFLKDIAPAPAGGISQIFTMAPGYRDLYRYSLILRHGLSINGDFFKISGKDIAVLYEYWCFIKLNSLMKKKYKLIRQDFIKTNRTGISVTLVKGSGSKVEYLNEKTGEKIALSYNQSERESPTVSQRPDNILCLEKKPGFGRHGSGKTGSERNASGNYEYIFDAKYRIETDYSNSGLSSCQKPGPKLEDINTMHRYRDAIVCKYGSEKFPYRHTMFGAYVLFPYRNEEEYKDHRFYKSIEEVNIGGLPFLPGATELVEKLLDELINDSPDSAFERTVLPKGTAEKFAEPDWKRNVLVIPMENERHLEICRCKKVAAISLNQKLNTENLPIQHIALYQPKSKFGDNSGIFLFGEVLSMESNDRFYSGSRNGSGKDFDYFFIVKEWKELPHPVAPKEIGFSYILTNRFLLENSNEIPELLLRSPEEYRIYAELKRRADTVIRTEDSPCGKPGGFSDEPVFESGNIRVYFRNGEIRMTKNGFPVEEGSVSVGEFSKRPNACFRKIMEAIQDCDNETEKSDC